MERNEFALAGAFALILCATLLLALVLAGSRFADMASWAQAIGTVGAIIAAIMVPIWDRRHRTKHDQSIAALRVAAHLRAWLGPCAQAVQNLESYETSDGETGTDDLTIPPMGFDMNEVPGMKLDHAKVIYSILEQHARAVAFLRGGSEFFDDDEMREKFYNESARLFRRVRNRYRILAREFHLHESTCQQWELDVINRAGVKGDVRNWMPLGPKDATPLIPRSSNAS